MKNPDIMEMVSHLADHYGLPRMTVAAILRTPLHPPELRDTFAGHALQGICASGPSVPNEIIAREAYGLADAMLEARKV